MRRATVLRSYPLLCRGYDLRTGGSQGSSWEPHTSIYPITQIRGATRRARLSYWLQQIYFFVAGSTDLNEILIHLTAWRKESPRQALCARQYLGRRTVTFVTGRGPYVLLRAQQSGSVTVEEFAFSTRPLVSS